MTPSERRDLRLFLALPDSIAHLEKGVEVAERVEKERLTKILEQNKEEYGRLKNLYQLEV